MYFFSTFNGPEIIASGAPIDIFFTRRSHYSNWPGRIVLIGRENVKESLLAVKSRKKIREQ